MKLNLKKRRNSYNPVIELFEGYISLRFVQLHLGNVSGRSDTACVSLSDVVSVTPWQALTLTAQHETEVSHLWSYIRFPHEHKEEHQHA